MTRRLITAAASAVLVLGLAACDDGKGPVTTPPPDLGFKPQTSDGGGDETNPSDGGSEDGASDGGGDETQAAPDIPAPDRADFPGMDEHTDHGAMQAFKYYIATAMWAHQVGDDSLTQEMQTEDCDGCDDFMKTYKDIREHDNLWTKFSLQEVVSEAIESNTYDIQVNYNFTTTPHMRSIEDPSEIVDVGELEYATAGGLVWTEEGWRIDAVRAKWGTNVLD
ncbi:DUF6318 family protein [Brachybacterium sp. UMB0905]|uniref:DUF6318 family protein n=1 Tax=Brachybacterium sp. UMB0905 TaxID=2069310 RepID=UPI000C80A71A|nr:DUF6318 family protein [Brachybacterium sp. UMB0905]PMC76808.1 hypothetical protein CJ197_00300 [Brachybacterium sp. UMB0905]